MPDLTTLDHADEVLPVPPAKPPVQPPTIEGLAKSVRRMRVWLIIVTVVLGLFLATGVAGIATAFLGIGSFMDQASEPTDERIAKTEQAVKDAFGDRLDSLDVHAVSVDYGAPFPYSFLSDEIEKSVYVQYSLKGSDVVVADMPNGIFGDDVESSGMLPTAGALADRMTIEQFEKLLVAYRAETRNPLGAVHRYGSAQAEAEGEPAPEKLTVAGKSYKTEELWSATEGRIIKGDKVKMDETMGGERKALVFHEDPKTGQFTYLGTEPVELYW